VRRAFTTLAALVALAALHPALARADEPPPLAITHATVYVPGGKRPLDDATVVIDKGKIVSVTDASAALPPGALVLDSHGKSVTAGFIDADADLGAVEFPSERVSNDLDARGLLHPALRMFDAYNPRSRAIPVVRDTGVTSVVVAPRWGVLAGQSAFADLAGDTQAEAVVRPSLASYARADEIEAQALGTRGGLWMTLRQAVDDARFYGAHRAQYDANGARALSLPRLDLEALQPVLRGEQPLVVTVHRASDIEGALRFAVEQKIKIVLRGASEAWLLADDIARAHVPVILDPFEDLPAAFDRLRSRSDNAALLAAAGVSVAISTLGSHEERSLVQRAGNAVRLGMDHDAAIRAVTEAPADAFGLKDYGRLQAGAVANVVVWSGDPLQIGSRAEHVFIRGHEQPLETRQTLLLNRYRTLPFAHDGKH
jgi:imidazolonepropionase-like amidohydrolase